MKRFWLISMIVLVLGVGAYMGYKHLPAERVEEARALAGQTFARASYGWDMLVPQLEKIYQQNPHQRQTAQR